MNTNQFDSEYYVMNVDGANNHPLLAWGKTRRGPFLQAALIDEKTLSLPLQIVFDEPYPKQYEMADFLMLGAQFAGSETLKKFFERNKVYGAQFVPIEITTNKKEIITGHYAIHFHNRLRAIDENNYEGGEPDEFGEILDLSRFSLNAFLLNNIPIENRLVFVLEEDAGMIIVHQSIYEAIRAENLTGMRFWKVSDWDNNAMFR
ncbi:hypothetical protein FACS1894103_1090 [Campylobacterota bacterium]|nr:hypothetical protein FACS1894103_1090 [Campylobacterota bacterium]